MKSRNSKLSGGQVRRHYPRRCDGFNYVGRHVGESAAADSHSRPPRRTRLHGFTLVELLVVIAVIGLLMSLLLPAVQAAREAGRSTACDNNLKQIGLAIHQYDQIRKCLPPAQPLGTSPFLVILPYLDEQSLYSRYNQKLSYSDPANIDVTNSAIAAYRCPSMVLPDKAPSPGWSSYAVCTGSGDSHFTNASAPDYHNGAIVDPAAHHVRTSVYLISTLDGTGKTLMAGDMNYGLKNAAQLTNNQIVGGTTQWAFVYTGCAIGSIAGVFDSDHMITGFLEWDTFRSDHPGGVNFVMVDGSVKFISETTNDSILKSLAIRDDGGPSASF